MSTEPGQLQQRLRPRNATPPAALANSALGAWALELLARKPWRVVMVALANKLARIAWAVATRGTAFQPAGSPPALAASEVAMTSDDPCHASVLGKRPEALRLTAHRKRHGA